MQFEENKSTYIRNVQASKIYEHMNRGSELKCSYDGSLPFSLEFEKEVEIGMKVKENKRTGKKTTNDIMNVKFDWKVKSSKEIVNLISKKIKKIELDINRDLSSDQVQSKSNYIENMKLRLEEVKLKEWEDVKSERLREIFYKNGFVLDGVKYEFDGRSGSKSRTGQALFIKKTFYKKMLLWRRMGIKKLTKEGIRFDDLAGLLTYEKLVGSSIISKVNIPTENILMISDVDSVFKMECNVVKTNPSTNLLGSYNQIAEVRNSLFDGQSLLDAMYFKNGKSMKLLRHHFFKSASFKTYIQKALRYLCPKEIDYDTWHLNDMFGNKILAKDVHMIMTPTSLKALKFSSFVGSDSDMYDHWKKIVKKEGNLFGVVKHEKASKRGDDIQQTSYQMLNSMPLTQNDISNLATYEKDFIDSLKNDDDFFIEYLIKESDIMNSNEAYAAIYNINKEFADTKVFKDYRSSKIKAFVHHTKKGKIRLKGDYCVMIGNPIEELLHAVGSLPVDKETGILDKDYIGILKNNEIYTSLFKDDDELVGFRNPHTSQSNVLISKNKFKSEFKEYFNFSKNIVIVNAINFELQDMLSGCDKLLFHPL